MAQPEIANPELTPRRRGYFIQALHELHRRNPGRLASGGFELPDIVQVAACKDPDYDPTTSLDRFLAFFGHDCTARRHERERLYLADEGQAQVIIGGLVQDGVVETQRLDWESVRETYGRHPLEDWRLYRLSALLIFAAETVQTLPIETTLQGL